jgi:hypothetical protein
VVTYLNPQYPKSGTTFQEIACWADDVRPSQPSTAPWHFIDIPTCRWPANPAGCIPPTPDDNVVWAIEQAEEAVSGGTVTSQKAQQLRFLTHFVGDIHQPPHAATYFSPQFPDGDRGGNSWKISGAAPATELHALWDEGLGMWTKNLIRPLNATGRAWLTDISAKIRAQYPASSLQPDIMDTNVTNWALDSHSFTETFVYTAPQAPFKIPADYITQGQAIVLKQIAIAGYRLADTLQFLLSAAARNATYMRVKGAAQ